MRKNITEASRSVVEFLSVLTKKSLLIWLISAILLLPGVLVLGWDVFSNSTNEISLSEMIHALFQWQRLSVESTILSCACAVVVDQLQFDSKLKVALSILIVIVHSLVASCLIIGRSL